MKFQTRSIIETYLEKGDDDKKGYWDIPRDVQKDASAIYEPTHYTKTSPSGSAKTESGVGATIMAHAR